MNKPKICAVITENNFDLIAGVDRFVDLYEVRIDLIGNGWQEWIDKLQRPWIACNRLPEEGGNWLGNESSRIETLIHAIKLGASIVDIELRTPDLSSIVSMIKSNNVKCLISSHNLLDTPPIEQLARIVQQQIESGADICKVVTTAKRFEDNFTILKLFEKLKETRIVAFAMGNDGVVSRVLSAISGGYFTYASITGIKGSATGQLSATYLRSFYEAVKNNHD
jgi:3-dehydroquinate dehydratase I